MDGNIGSSSVIQSGVLTGLSTEPREASKIAENVLAFGNAAQEFCRLLEQRSSTKGDANIGIATGIVISIFTDRIEQSLGGSIGVILNKDKLEQIQSLDNEKDVAILSFFGGMLDTLGSDDSQGENTLSIGIGKQKNLAEIRYGGEKLDPLICGYIEHTIQSIISRLESIFKNRYTITELNTLVYTDGLTSIANRKAMDYHLDGYDNLLRKGLIQKDVSMMVIDIDNYGQFNKLYGHQTGDAVLKEVARFILDRKRIFFGTDINNDTHGVAGNQPNDLVARLGGDEFLIYQYDCDLSKITEFTEFVLSGIRNSDFSKIGIQHPITLSIGVVSVAPDDNNYLSTDLKSLGDKALRNSKVQGRDRATFYQLPLTGMPIVSTPDDTTPTERRSTRR